MPQELSEELSFILFFVSVWLIGGSLACALYGHMMLAVLLMYFGAPAMKHWVYTPVNVTVT